MAILDLIPGGTWRWLALALVALGGAGIGWLARSGNVRPPLVRRRISLDAAAGVDPAAIVALRRAIGRALVRRAPEVDLLFGGPDDGVTSDLRIDVRQTQTGLVLARPESPMTLDVPGPHGSIDAGAEAAAYLLSNWSDEPTARAIIALTAHSERFEMRLLGVKARYRLPDDATRPVRDDEARRLIETWPAESSEIERHRLASPLAASLIAAAVGPASAVQAYLALHVMTEALGAHWAAGRLDEAVEARHLIAEIRLTLARAEAESRHLDQAREEIAHVLAYRPRAAQAERRTADLVLAATIEQASAVHEPGTEALERAAAYLRQALSDRETQTEEPVANAALAAALADIGTRLASPGRLREAIAVARTAVRAGAPPFALARPLLALGLLLRDVNMLEEASAVARSDRTPDGRRIEARALSMAGTLRSDTAALEQALAIWRDLEAAHPRTSTDLRWHARTALVAARYTVDRAAIADAIELAEALVATAAQPPIAQALDRVLLAEALRTRRQLIDDPSNAIEREAELLDEALATIGSEPLPHVLARVTEYRRQIDCYPVASDAIAPAVPDFEHALTAMAMWLRDESPASLVRSRRAILALIDAAACLDDEPRLAIMLAWLERIERTMMERP